MSDSLFCSRCDLPVHDPLLERVELSGDKYHLKASCPRCLRYLRFISQGGPVKLYFGKYKDKELREVARRDPDYLRWLKAQDWCKTALREAIDDTLAGVQ